MTQIGHRKPQERQLDDHAERFEDDGLVTPLRIVAIATLAFGLLVFFLLTRRVNTPFYEPLVLCVLLPLSMALYIYSTLTFCPRKTCPWFCLCLLAPWWLLCSFCGGDTLGPGLYSFKILALILFSAGVCFPFAKLTDDLDGRRVLDTVLVSVVGLCALLWWLAYIGVVRHEPIEISGLMFGMGYSKSGSLLFCVASMHPYTQGFLASTLTLIICYLAVSHPSRRNFVAAALLELTFLPGVFVSGGRMVLGGFVMGFVYLLVLAIRDTSAPRATKRALVSFAAAMTCVGAIFWIVLNYRYLTHSTQDVLYGATSLTSRTEIWRGVFDSFADHPEALLFGYSDGDVMKIVNSYIPLPDNIMHTHSSYMQVLAVHGVPGLVLILTMVAGILASGYRLLRADVSEGITLADKLLVAAPLCMIIESLTEVILFASNGRCMVANALFMLLSGYVVFTAAGLPRTGTQAKGDEGL